MAKLVLQLHRSGQVIVGWVEEQAETLRNRDPLSESTLATVDGLRIASRAYPELCGWELSVRGRSASADRNVFAHAYDGIEEAGRVYAAIRKAVARINAEPTVEGRPIDGPAFERIE